jgi:hypothetical protein
MERNNLTNPPLLLRISPKPGIEENLPKLLTRMSTLPPGKRKRELSIELSGKWKSSAKKSAPVSKRRHVSSSCVANELEKWAGASDKEKGKAFDSYLAEINSFIAVQDKEQSATRETSSPLGVALPARNFGGK